MAEPPSKIISVIITVDKSDLITHYLELVVMDDIIKEFLVESNENLDRLDRDFVALEKSPTDKELLSSIFRVVHTIKGTCGFLGFNKLEKVSHVGENLLSKLRDGELRLNPEITTALLSMVDAIRKMMLVIEKTESDGDEEYASLIELLTTLCDKKSVAEEIVIEIVKPEVIENKNITADVEPDKSHEEETKPKNSSINESTIRVDVKLLDKLMNLVGELVLSRNQILQFTNKQDDSAFQATSQRLNIITTELQEHVMKTRMQPIDNIWSKFPRVVRDLSQSLGKKIEVKMEGKETEIDKSIIESIKDPLTHLVRNSVDHGVEMPDIRIANGKPETGILMLKAYHEGGMVNIEISDDGGGINTQVLKEKAIEKGLYTKDQLDRMKESDVINIIFMPGFSTAKQVTNVSGRGVGMDVVKTNIEKIGGMLDIQSALGVGTSMRIKIPLTLAIIPALIVTCHHERYAIPQVSLVELVMLEGSQIKDNIELIDDAAVYRLRDQLLPLIRLDTGLGLNKEKNYLLLEKDIVRIVVLQANNRQFGLVVDDINDTQEIVVKPLSKLLKGISVFAGATIMGDGDIALILDAIGIAQYSNLLSTNNQPEEINNDQQTAENNQMTLLIFKSDEKHRMAVNLSSVSRLEEFESSKIEFSGTQEVIQYRECIMPLIRLSGLLGVEAAPTNANLIQVIVCRQGQQEIGIIVDNIIDIIDAKVTYQSPPEPGALYQSAIVQNHVTEIIDVDAIIQHALPHYISEVQ